MAEKAMGSSNYRTTTPILSEDIKSVQGSCATSPVFKKKVKAKPLS